MNSVTLLGRLVRDPDVRYTDSGKTVAIFTLAVDRFAKADGQKEADFINCVIWGKQAELIGNSVSKGQRLLVTGRLQIRQYQDKTGANRYATEVVCNSFEYIEGKGNTQQPKNNSQTEDFNSFGSSQPFDEEVPF